MSSYWLRRHIPIKWLSLSLSLLRQYFQESRCRFLFIGALEVWYMPAIRDVEHAHLGVLFTQEDNAYYLLNVLVLLFGTGGEGLLENIGGARTGNYRAARIIIGCVVLGVWRRKEGRRWTA